MKIKKLLVLASVMFASISLWAQNVQIFSENFESGGGTFFLNAAGVGSNTGTNEWIVNNNYTGGGAYPNTMNEDSTFGGTISFAPFGHYLHIYDATSGYTDCLYAPANTSDRFAYMWNGICTMGLDSVSFNFFYLCQGSPTAYGMVYYSANGGPWTPCGAPMYNSKYKWQYATIKNPAFDDVNNLKFGFRWENNSVAGKDTSAFAIDDIDIVGNYDSVNHPVNITCSVTPDTICAGGGGFANLTVNLSDTLCDGTYSILLSNGSGSFTSFVAGWSIGIYYPSTTTGPFSLGIPSSVPPGNCYKFRVDRVSPAPVITGIATGCIVIENCPPAITTLQPLVTTDTAHPVCAGSVIIVPFWSTGTFNTFNTYFAELSDSSGSFSGNYDTIGSFPSNNAYPPVAGVPGSVSGQIPFSVPAGCNYYIRIVSDTPSSTGTTYGPFCIQHCDIVTDSVTNIQACIQSCYKNPAGFTQVDDYKIHKYDTNQKYIFGNKFEVQLLSTQTFAVVNTGGLGVTVDTSSGKMYVHVPCGDSLCNILKIPPASYYMRIISTKTSQPDSTFGTLIFLNIGYPNDSTVIYPLSGTTTYCVGSIADFFPDPYNSCTNNWTTSTYQWYDNSFLLGTNSFFLSLLLNGAGPFYLAVRENNNGCFGPLDSLKINVEGPPSASITGPTTICIGDTATYTVPFANNVYYKWTATKSSTLDTANNVVKVTYNTAGTYVINVSALDSCGKATSTKVIKVVAPPTPSITGTTSACKGVPMKLNASGGTKYKWSTGATTSSITVTPPKDTSYIVNVSNGACSVNDTVNVTVLPTPTVTVVPNSQTICMGDTVTLTASGANTYTWYPNTGLNKDTGNVVIATPTVTTVYKVVGGSGGCSDSAKSTITIDVPVTSVGTFTVITTGQSVQLDATGGTKYAWNTGATTSSITVAPTTTTTYSVLITDANNCSALDTVTIEVQAPCGDLFVPTAFSPNDDGQNDILYARYQCAKSIDFIIYDRWGNKVFETQDVNVGWDGKYGGMPMNAGTYVYYITVLTTNGDIKTQKGNITLVR